MKIRCHLLASQHRLILILPMTAEVSPLCDGTGLLKVMAHVFGHSWEAHNCCWINIGGMMLSPSHTETRAAFPNGPALSKLYHDTKILGGNEFNRSSN
jgi:hypothetical protein